MAVETFTVKIDTETGDYHLIGDDGDQRSEGSLIDEPSLAIDIIGCLGLMF